MQIEFNLKHGIKPEGIKKAVRDIMEGANTTLKNRSGRGSKNQTLANEILNSKPIANIALEIKNLEDQMYKHAKNLEFEDAARVRDLLGKLRERSLAS